MIKVLFVCLGNICRSPMAEAIFRKIVQQRGWEDKIFVDSAGTGDWHIGEPPHKGTREILTKKNISIEGKKARQISQSDLSNFDYIIGMDAENIGNLRRMAGAKSTGHIARLLDYVPECSQEDVPDPYFTGDFNEVYDLVSEGCHHLLNDIVAREKL
ncbi:low molecular weight protein-tyrosine-phosphatase [Fictibacillus gelatini]|uniref:low molecular weight protein-tyrosine-phosphatase n=1 Tax=Fictibacillus gelatini TaxID=225985 RepID=UPI000412AD19|nr:low molecular weight protein-tyrosine-phosphatase [Fictibacillus gelatini]